ncbi:MAG: N-acetylmuramoyl-L-alanine amidase [Armatimonadota bacterium]
MHIRFKIVLAFILSVMVSAGHADQGKLVIGGKPHKLPLQVIENTVYAPTGVLGSLAADYKLEGKKIRITPASGDEFTVTTRTVDKNVLFPIVDAAPKLGAQADWDAETRTLTLRARVTRIEVGSRELRVETSFPVEARTYNTDWTRANGKVILDLLGAYLPKKPDIYNEAAVLLSTGMQDGGDTARIVLTVPPGTDHRITSPAGTTRTVVQILGLAANGTGGSVIGPVTRETPPVQIGGISYRKDGAKRMYVYIDTDRQTTYTTYMLRDPDRLVLDIKNAELAKPLANINLQHDLLTGIRTTQRDATTVRVVMDLTRIASFDVEVERSPSRFAITLDFPKGAGGLLAHKVVVIDPGHGGKDTGAKGCTGSYEKDSNLAIATRLQRLLADAGVCALMTRQSDTYVELKDRGSFGSRHSADIFISIHGNSCPVPNTISGIETFYHGGDASGRALAECIHSELIRASGMQDRSVKADTSRFQTGFAVLRGTASGGIPGTLLELGFINHADDESKITDGKFQERIAAAIVRGLKVYVEGQSKPIKRASADEGSDDPTAPERPGEGI